MALGKRSVLRFGKFVLQKRSGTEQKSPNENCVGSA
jgi:hypothetical protein